MDALSIVVPALNEELYIEHCVGRLVAQLPADGRLYVADGGSTDRTRELVRQMSARDPRIELVDNPRRTQAAGINIVANKVKDRSHLLIRADAHAEYTDDYVSGLLATYERHHCASVVVRMDTRAKTCFQKAAAAAQNNPLGNGASPHRMPSPREGEVDHGKHALFELPMFLGVGGYDERFRANEDAELDVRIAKAGGKIWLNPAVPVFYFPRRTPAALAKQYFYYGLGRFQTCDKHQIKPKLRQLLPTLATAANLVALALAPFVHAALLLPLVYCVACLAWGTYLAVQARDRCVLGSGLAAGIMHMAFGVGYIWGWASRRRDWTVNGPLDGADPKLAD